MAADSTVYWEEITEEGRLERAISSSSWVENLMGDNKKTDRVTFRPLQSTVTYDAEKIMPGESVVFIKRRTTLNPVDFIESEQFKNCSIVDTRAVTSIRAASEIMDSIASISLLQYSMYSRRNLIPLFLSAGNRKEFGGKVIRRSMLKRCFSKTHQVDSLLEELEKRKTNAAKAFAHAVREKSVVNAALAAWSAGNAASLQHLVKFSKIKYGPGKTYNVAGIFSATHPTTGKNITSSKYMAEIKNRHRGSLDFDSAASIFNTALARVFLEFKTAVDDGRITEGPMFSAVRQRRQKDLSDGLDKLGMLAPRERYTEADYMQAEKSASDQRFFSKISSELESFRGGHKRKADTETEDLKDTLAKSIADSALDASAILTSADLQKAAANNLEWSMHITQLFSQAFLETMSSSLACSFGIQNPFTDDGMDAIAGVIRRQNDNRYVDMNPSILADEYLLFAGNFQIVPFNSSDPSDIVEGRQVCPNTPMLSIVTRYKTADGGIVSDVEFRDRLMVKDDVLNQAVTNTVSTPVTDRNEPTDVGAPKMPMLAGCLPVIRGPLAFKRDVGVDDVVNSLANDWYITTGVYYSIGKTSAAICAGYQRAIASAKAITNTANKAKTEDQKHKKSMRRNADRSARLAALLGQTISEWSHQEHNSTLDSFWSSSAAVRSKVAQDALSRSKIIGVRKLLDGKCNNDEFLMAEQQLRNSFFNTVSHSASYDIDSIVNFSDGYSKFSQWFDNDTSGAAMKSWKYYEAAMSNLSEHEQRAFNVQGLFSAIKKFKFPLVAPATEKRLKKRHCVKNLKAANRIINGLTEMILQSAFNGLSTNELGMGIGSAADGWGPGNNQLEPSRMKALKLMAKFGRQRPDVISIPISRSRGSISGLEPGITSVDIPAVIMSHLVSDKKILDDLCGDGMNLANEITKFIQTLSGVPVVKRNAKRASSIFATGKHSIMLLRYMWFNTAVISLTDSNIKTPLNVSSKGLGDSLYRDYLAIRSLISHYNRNLSDFSINAVSERYSCDGIDNTGNKNENITINTDGELLRVLQQTTDALSAFTNIKDGTAADSSNMAKVIETIDDVDTVKNALVNLTGISTAVSLNNFSALLQFLFDIGNMNMNLEEPLRRFALGKGLNREEMDNYVQPDLTKVFKRELGVHGVARNTPLGAARVVEIDLNKETPLMVKTNAGYVTERIAAISAIPLNNQTTADKDELGKLAVEVKLQQLPSLINKITVAGFMTPTVAINIVNAFTSEGRYSNKNSHMDVLIGTIEIIQHFLKNNVDIDNDSLVVTVEKVGEFIQNGLLFCFICAHSHAGRYIIDPIIKDFSKLLSDVAAETSLVVSRLQSSFYPLPPSVFALTGMFKPDKNLFDDMIKDYFSEIVTHLTTVTSNAMSERCDDNLSSAKIFKAGENYNSDHIPAGAPAAASAFNTNLKNPAAVWSSSALPHFDVAVVPRLHSKIDSDQILRLSSYYHGMHKMSFDPDCAPQSWDTTLAGNLAGKFFGLGGISDINRSFNSALDALIASPVEMCDIVSRETVRTSNDVIHNIGSAANTDKIQKLLQLGTSAVKPAPASRTTSPAELSIKETISALSKNGSTSDGYATAKEIVRTWNTLSLTNHCQEAIIANRMDKNSDVVRAPLVAVPSFRQNVIEATKSVYELAAVCCVMSNDEAVRSASRKVMAAVEETSPVIHDIGISRVAGLVSTAATPKQYRKFLHAVADHRNSLVRLVNGNPLSNNNNCMKAVYDGLLYKTPRTANNPLCSSTTASLPDRFWMGVFNECLENTNTFADKTSPASLFSFSTPAKIYGSRVNTYAAISHGIDRSKDAMAANDEERRDKIVKGIADIEKYVTALAGDNDSPLSKLINAQRMYTKLSDITANSVYSDFSSVTCDIIKNVAGTSKTARQQSDSILSATLHELASALYAKHRGLASQLALACHIIIAKGVNTDLTKHAHRETFDNLLSVAGVTDYAYVSANALCRRLKSTDIKMFLGGTMLQQGLFVTFLLNNVLFAQLSDSIKMDELSAETKSLLVKLTGFCGTLSDALNARHARRKINRTAGGHSFATEEAKVDACFVSTLYSAYKNLALRPDTTSAAQIFSSDIRMSLPVVPKNVLLERSIRGTQPKRNSTLSDILEAPSIVQKTFMTSFTEKAAASRQVRRAAGSLLLSSNKMKSIYGSEILNDMRAFHSPFMDDDCSDFDEFSDDERMSISSVSSSSSSESDVESESSDEDFGGGNFSFDALDRLNAMAAPLSSIYGCGGDSDISDDDDSVRRRNTALGDILRDVGEGDGDFEDDDDDDDDDDYHMPNTESENAARRRCERIQFGPGFLSHSFLFNHPAKTRAFLTRGKKYRPTPGQSSWRYLGDDDAAIFSDEYSSDSETEEIVCGGRRHRVFKRRGAEDQCAFIRRVMRVFVPSKISLVNGRVSLITPVGTDTATGFFETYQKANKKERENLRKKFNITAAGDSSLPAEYLKGSPSKTSTPRELRRSLIKASAYVSRTQTANAEIFYTAIVAEAPTAAPLTTNPSVVLSESILYSKELKSIIDERNHLLKNLADVSFSLFTSPVGQGPGGSANALEEARKLANQGESNRPGYLGIPLRNLAGCMRTKAIAPSDAVNNTGISVDSLLAITDRNHLEWMTTAAITFARAYNVTTFYAVESTLKTSLALGDMYNAFAKLVSSQDKEKIQVKSTLLDSIFNTRMAHLEAVLGLVYPTAFVNHEMPSDSNQRKRLQSLALNILRGINSNQLPRSDIGDTSGLLAFLTSTKFAGRGGERGGLSLYRMSVTDALSNESPENRLKGAVSLEVGKWEMCDNSVFSKRSKDLTDYCSQKFLSLENAVGPIARFIPNGTVPDTVGLSKLPPMFVSDDPAALRLKNAEYGCGAAGRFITASAEGNLYGCIDDIINLAKKFTAVTFMAEAAIDNSSINDVVKDIVLKMKARRNKSLKTPFGDATISQATNFPATSDAIVIRAREMKSSISTIVADLSKKHGIGLTSCAPGATAKVSVKTFERILETTAVLANTKMAMRGFENRLAAAYAHLKQFKCIANDGLSESRVVITAVAEAMNPLDSDDNGKRFTVADFMNDNDLFRFIVSFELRNIEDAKRQITAAIEGACQLHAKLLSMLAATVDFDSNSEQCQRLNDIKVSPMTHPNCGTIIKHPGTGLWLKTDEDCNTPTDSDVSVHRRVAQSILSVVRNNRNKSLRSELHAMCFGKYAVSDIFVLDNSDVKNVDKLVEKLGAALASRASSLTVDVAAASSIVSANKEGEYSSSCASMSKKIPYIPIVFENRREKKKVQASDRKSNGKEDAVDEQKAAVRQLEIQEAIDLSNILSTATKHKFVTHNQAAIVAIFNGNQKAESIIPEAEGKKSAGAAQSVLTKLPAAVQASSGTTAQLPPSSVSKGTPVVVKLRGYAVKVASELLSAPEYKDLKECQRKITSAIDRLNTIENGSFFTSGIRPEIKQTTMTALSHCQSAKEGALELFEKVLSVLEAHTPDPSLSTVSLPVDASSALPDKKSTPVSTAVTDFFHYAYEKLHSTEIVDSVEKVAVTKNLVEEESAIRVPLLLSSPQFASVLREVVNSFAEYFQRVEKIKQKITNEAKYAVSSSFTETDREITTDKNSLLSIIDELSKMYSDEADAIKTAIKVIENKKSELELQNNHTSAIIDNITSRIEAGEVNADVNDMLNYGNKADNDQQFLQNLKMFATDNSGVVYTPPNSNNSRNKKEDNRQIKLKDSYYRLLNDAITTIKKGQEGVITDYEIALSKFPAPSTSYDTLTMQTAEKQQRDRLASVEMFIGTLVNRASKLRARLDNSSMEATEVETKKQKIDAMFRRQVEDRYYDTKKNVGIAESAAHSSLAKDISQSAFMMALSGKVDKLLQRLERVGGTLTSSSSRSNVHASKSVNQSVINCSVERVEDPAYSCFMSPFHETIKRMTALYNKDRKGPLSNNRGVPTSEADLQIMTIVDLSAAVLNAASGSKNPDIVPSSIVPGLCQLCAMVITNMHEAIHESSHSFNFEEKRSRKKLIEMLNAVTSGSDNPRIRHDVLAMLEANNGHIKEYGFMQKQKVACVTPVNTLLGGTFNGDMAPNTVLLPTSELFSCPGLDNDKFRSMVHRSVDKTVADAPKTAASIVETLARTAPNAENLYFPFKDQRRHFNSITNAIVSNMSSEASSQLNTTCDQNLVEIDRETGFPAFVGRRAGKSRALETDASDPVARGGVPGCTNDRLRYVDVCATFMVAPGSLLNANKEETLRLNRLSDINNVRHYGTDVHVAGANAAWRIGEVIKAASASSEKETAARRLLLLGSVSAVSAQKSAQYNNDPTAMLNTTSAVQNLVNEAFPAPISMAFHAGAAESAFATQLAYRQRLFPSSGVNLSSSASPMDILGKIRRYSDSFNNIYPSNKKCDHILKQSMANVPLLSTPYGVFEEASSAVRNRISPLFNSQEDYSTVNKLSVLAMTDTVVDTLSAVSAMVGRHKLPPSILSVATSGKPMLERNRNTLLQALSRISRDASLLSQINDESFGDSLSSSSLSSFLKASSPLSSSTHNKIESLETAAEMVLGAILDGARESSARLERLGVGKGGSGRPEVNALYRNAMASVLQLNEDEIARDINDVESKFETRHLREAFNELKKAMLVSTGSSSDSLNIPMSALVSRGDVASGRLALSNNSNVMSAVDEFNTTPLLVRHLMLDSGKSPVTITKEVRGILTQPKAITARALLSESSPLLTELCLFNTRDTQPERAIDRLVTSAYLVKQAKRFDGVDPLFPAAITGAAHLMLSSMDSPSSFLNNIKLHMNDTTCFLKNIERYERILGKYGDSYAMSQKQNCNCPFALHHDFRPSADENLVSSFAFARPELTVEEIRATPYQANKLLNDKHYVMALSKVDPRVTGSALLKKVSEWTEMRMNVNFNGAFEPSRLALSNSGMTTAGVNLDVIVRPNNAKNVMGILECHRKHICSVDAKSTIAAAMPAVFQSTSTDSPGNASELVQNALPRNRYIQKSTMNAHTVIFANVLEQLVCDLGNVIVNELAGLLATSVSESVQADTKSMIDTLGSEALFNSNLDSKTVVGGSGGINSSLFMTSAPKLVSESMKNAIYHCLISGKSTDAQNVPFASSANGSIAYDFMLSKESSFREDNVERGAAAAVANMPQSSVLRKLLARVFEAISKQVTDAEFGNILDEIEAKIIDELSSPSSNSSQALTRAFRQEFNKILSFLKILRKNITPALLEPGGILAEKVAIYVSLLSTKSKLENLLHYGLSNSSSVDLSHLKPINGSNNIKNIEDTFMYRNVHPVLLMALPDIFTALLQQEQCDAELAIENRRALTTFLNHPNTTAMATSARASVGAGGGNPLGLYVSSHILHESTVTTCDPVVDMDSKLSFHSSVTQDPMMVVNPFKETAKLKLSDGNAMLDNKCNYLQVSMPSEFSGLVTNTGVKSITDTNDTFKFVRRDNSPIYLPKVTPSVLCSDASTNHLDIFSRADVVLTDVNVRFGFMPEIIEAIANVKGTSSAEVIRDMSARAGSPSSTCKNTSVDAKTGDVIVKNGTFPDVRSLESVPSKVSWGEDDKQKLHARIMPAFMVSNPLASASVNGVPITFEGFLLAEEKRRKAAGISSKEDVFGYGCTGSGALRAAANSRLTSDLEPLRKGWESVMKLRNVFSKAAANLKNAMNKSGNNNLAPETAAMALKLHENYKKLDECKEILQNQTSLLVATSDLVTGGYAGDPSTAMIAPVRPETTGLIGAISAPVRGLGHLLKNDGVAAVNATLKEKLNLSSSNGRIIPEHGVVYKSSNELLTDADSIRHLYSIDEDGKKNEGGHLDKVMMALGLRGDGGNIASAANYVSSLLPASDYGNRRDLAKRQGIVRLLVSNPELLSNVSNALFFTVGKHSISPLTAADTSRAIIGGARGMLQKKHVLINDGSSVESLNRLFASRL